MNLKKNTISKTEFDKLKEENRNLLKAIVEQQTPAAAAPEEPAYTKKDLDEARKALSGDTSNMTNLEFMKRSLKLREVAMALGERDPWLPNGRSYVPTSQDLTAVEEYEAAMRECIDKAEDDPKLFMAEVSRRFVDTSKNNIKRR